MNVKSKKVKVKNRWTIFVYSMCFGTLIFNGAAHSQTGGSYAVTQSVIAAGGASNSTGGSYSIDGTIGQTVAGQTTAGTPYRLNAGFWTPANLAPTAATVSIGGRVMTADGRGIRNARIILTGVGEPKTVLTGTFGYYRFDEIPAGATIILSVTSKRFAFDNPTRIVSVFEELADLDFTAADQ